MSQPPRPRLDPRGAVDLSTLARPQQEAPSGPSSAWVTDVDASSFAEVVQSSAQFPVIVVLWAAWSSASKEAVADLVALADEDAGRWLLARIDADASPEIAQALGTSSVPVTVAVLAGRPLPLYEGQPPREQVRGVIDQVLAAAAANGIDGTVTVSEPEPAPAEVPVPPLHQAARLAIARDDVAGAKQAYEQALLENPGDDLARSGLAQVALMERVQGLNLQEVRRRAADAPKDVEAQLQMADLDVAGGHIQDAFDRLLDMVRTTAGESRDLVRGRLIDLFAVVGTEDVRVHAARRSLASALN